MNRWAQCLIFSFAIVFVSAFASGCSKQGANVAEPELMSIEHGGIPSPEDGMPGSMKDGATGPPAPSKSE